MRNAGENYPVNVLAGMWKKMARNHNVKLKNRLNPEGSWHKNFFKKESILMGKLFSNTQRPKYNKLTHIPFSHKWTSLINSWWDISLMWEKWVCIYCILEVLIIFQDNNTKNNNLLWNKENNTSLSSHPHNV